jgi:hypothetical protein
MVIGQQRCRLRLTVIERRGEAGQAPRVYRQLDCHRAACCQYDANRWLDRRRRCVRYLVPSPAGVGLKNQRAAWVSTAAEACLRGRCGLASFGLSSAPTALARDWSQSYFGLARMHAA